MADEITTLAKIVGGGYGLKKLLGPTLDYLGHSLRNATQAAFQNTADVIRRANSKLENRPDDEGSIPLRAARAVLDESITAEDEFIAEYLGGVLASSWTPQGRDDRGATWAKEIQGLSAYAVRLHYILYAAARVAVSGVEVNLNVASDRSSVGPLYIGLDDLVRAMDFGPEEDPMLLTGNAMTNLAAGGLIEHGYGVGEKTNLRNVLAEAPGNGLVFAMTLRGIELYLWAGGRGDLGARSLAASDLKVVFDLGLDTPTALTRANLRNLQDGGT